MHEDFVNLCVHVHYQQIQKREMEATSSWINAACVYGVRHKQHKHKVMFTMITNKQAMLHHRVLPSCPADGRAAGWARGTLTAPRVWLKTGRWCANTCSRCGCSGWAGSSASPPRSCGGTPAPGSAPSSPEPSRQRECQESSRPQRTSPWILRAAEEQGIAG